MPTTSIIMPVFKTSLDIITESILKKEFQFIKNAAITKTRELIIAITLIIIYVEEINDFIFSLSLFSIYLTKLFLNPLPNPKSNKLIHVNKERIVNHTP